MAQISVEIRRPSGSVLGGNQHRKGLQLGRISVDVSHGKVHAEDCAECEGRDGRIDRFERRITIEGGIPPGLVAKIVEIANKCPVHRTLEASSIVVTHLA